MYQEQKCAGEVKSGRMESALKVGCVEETCWHLRKVIAYLEDQSVCLEHVSVLLAILQCLKDGHQMHSQTQIPDKNEIQCVISMKSEADINMSDIMNSGEDDAGNFAEESTNDNLNADNDWGLSDAIESQENEEKQQEHSQDNNTITNQNVCEVCRKTYKSRAGLRDHVIFQHNGTPRYKCFVCKQGFMSKTQWRNHENSHLNEKEYKCELCNAAYCGKQKLKRHMTIYHGVGDHQTCEKCGKKFADLYDLKQHTVVCVDGKLFCCGTCGRTFTFKVNLKRHMKQVHKQDFNK